MQPAPVERVLIVGLGSIGLRHARLARRLLPQARIAAFRQQGCAGELPEGVDQCVDSLEAALAFRPDIAVIASPASRHLDSALPLAHGGAHIMVEKPIAQAGVHVQELIEASRAAGRVLMTAYNLRFLPDLQRFRALLQEGAIGRVLSVRAEVGQYLPSWRPDADYRKTVSAQAALGGGALLELSHEIDYLRWLFGEVDWVGAILSRQSMLEVDVEDTVHLNIGFAAPSGERPVIARLDLDFIRHDITRCCTVIGNTGSLRWNALCGTVERFAQGAKEWETLFEHPRQADESYLEEWRHFLLCAAGEAAPLVSGEDGLAVLRIVEAARQSAAGRAIVSVVRASAPVAQAMACQ